MIDKAHLTGKMILFRMTGINSIYSGTVKNVEIDGIWIETSDLQTELAQDSAWKRPYQRLVGGHGKMPAFFVPFETLQFLVAVPD